MATVTPINPEFAGGDFAAASGATLSRQAPYNIEAEQGLLGAILLNNDVAHRITGFVTPDHFYNAAHQRIFRAAVTLIERGQIANPVTLKTLVDRDEALAPLGGAGYLARLVGAATTIINAEDYARLIHDLAMRRTLIDIGEEMVNRAYDPDHDAPAGHQIEAAEARLFQLGERGKSEGGFIPFAESLRQSIESAQAAFQKGGGISGIEVGLRDLDHKLGGLHPSDLIILAGRPSMGKTALATCMAFNAAKLCWDTNGERGSGVAFFSLEMSAEQLATRILAEQAEIASERLRRGELSEDDFANKLVPATQTLEQVPFFIDDTGAIPISTLRARARRLKRTHPEIGMIVVDYLQLVRGPSSRANENRVQEISEVTQGLKALAKELRVPVLALSQLSRQVESRDDKRPQLSDLRESGAIEQDADVVMFVFREEYYERRKEPTYDTPEHAEWQQKMERIHDLAEVIIGKQRHGPIGNVTLRFISELTKFENYDSGQADV